MKQISVGDKVSIYGKPISKTEFEGVVVIVRIKSVLPNMINGQWFIEMRLVVQFTDQQRNVDRIIWESLN